MNRLHQKMKQCVAVILAFAMIVTGSGISSAGFISKAAHTSTKSYSDNTVLVSLIPDGVGDWSPTAYKYKVEIKNLTNSNVCDWKITATLPSGAAVSGTPWNNRTSVSGSKLTIIPKLIGTATDDDWTNATVEANSTQDAGGFYLTCDGDSLSNISMEYSAGTANDDEYTPVQATDNDVKVSATTKDEYGTYTQYDFSVSNTGSTATGDWILKLNFQETPSFNAKWGDGVTYSITGNTVEISGGSISAGGSMSGFAMQINPMGNTLVDATFNNEAIAISTTSGGSSGGSGGSSGSNPVEIADETIDYKYSYQENNFAKLLQYSLYFYDANMCGGSVSENSKLDWRGDCHTCDEQAQYNGTTVDVSGGFHDAGDHAKFGLPQAYSASVLGMGYYEFKDAYDSLGQTGHFKTIMEQFCDYFVKCTLLKSDQSVEAFCYQVGDGGVDHAYWGNPEAQASRSSQAYFTTDSNPGTDVVGETAAALAIQATNFPSDAKSAAYLATAKRLFAYADGNSTKKCMNDKNSSYYSSSSYADDMALAAAWLYRATKDTSYITAYKKYAASGAIGWPLSWDNVWSASLTYGGNDCTGDWSRAAETVNSYATKRTSSATGYTYVDGWGSARYNCALQFLGLAYDSNNESAYYTNWAQGQMEYLLGNNKDASDGGGQNYIVGYNARSSKYPHHRASSGYPGFPDAYQYTTQAHVLTGALVGGYGESRTKNTICYDDNSNDYCCNEVAIDYNAGLVGAAAGLYLQHKGEASQTVDSSLYSEAAKTTVTIESKPKASDLVYGDKLSKSTLTDGTASVAGTFSWDAPNTVLDAGTSKQKVVFTPEDTESYDSVAFEIPITVEEASQATPEAPVVQSTTATSVTVKQVPGAEYGMVTVDGTTYQDSNIFTGLQEATDYSFVIRMKAKKNYKISEASLITKATTKVTPKYTVDVSKVAVETYIPSLGETVFYDETKKEVTLKENEKEYHITGKNAEVSILLDPSITVATIILEDGTTIKGLDVSTTSGAKITVIIDGTVTISGAGQNAITGNDKTSLSIEGETGASLGLSSGDSYAGIAGADNVSCKDVDITIQAGTGIETGSLSISKSDVSITATNGDGITTTKDVIIESNSEVTVTASGTGISSSEGSVSMKDSAIVAKGENADISATEDIVISNSKVTASTLSKNPVNEDGDTIYTVSYDAAGGVGTLPQTNYVASGVTIQLANGDGLTKGEKIFAGWSDGTKNYAPGANVTVSHVNLVFTARWSDSAPVLVASSSNNQAESIVYGYSSSKEILITVENTGNATATGVQANLEGEDFEILESLAESIDAGESGQVRLALRSGKSVQKYEDLLVITTDDETVGATIAVSETVIKAENKVIPEAPVVQGTSGKNSITLFAKEGYEYAMVVDGVIGNFVTNPVFENLYESTMYTFVCRIAQTDNQKASEVSKTFTIKTTGSSSLSNWKIANTSNGMSSSLLEGYQTGNPYRIELLNNGSTDISNIVVTLEKGVASDFALVGVKDTLEAGGTMTIQASLKIGKKPGEYSDSIHISADEVETLETMKISQKVEKKPVVQPDSVVSDENAGLDQDKKTDVVTTVETVKNTAQETKNDSSISDLLNESDVIMKGSKSKIQVATGQTITSCVSSNSKIATVTNQGVVKGKKKGIALITVTLDDGNTLTFTVKVQNVKVYSVGKKIKLKKGKMAVVKAGSNPVNVYNTKSLSFKYSKKGIVKISKLGVISAKKKGKVKVKIYVNGVYAGANTITVK